ncbi:MAG: plasmid recombination protein [Roseburia sp.]|nr:plasmid recombination protein [Roseburia sp.]
MYGIMRTEKRQRNAVYGIQLEANRTQADHFKGREFHGSDIDWSLTEQNYPLIPINNNWNKTINETLAKYNIKPRKNSVVLLDTIYTASAEFFDGKTKEEVIEYFKACLEFHEKTYGKHIINAVIHFDEIGSNDTLQNEDGTLRAANYHLHIATIPLVRKKDGTYSLSASDLMGGRGEYRQKQDDFYSQVSSLWGLERGEVKDYSETRKHLNKMEYEVQQMQIKAEKAKTELDIRQRVLDACTQPMEHIEVLSTTNENKLLNRPATSTVRTSDLERLEGQIKTANDLQNGLKELNKLAKETVELASTEERVIELKEELRKTQSNCKQLQETVKHKNSEISRLTDYIQKWQQWFNAVKIWMHKRQLVKDFEQFIEHETKELVREEITYDEFDRG